MDGEQNSLNNQQVFRDYRLAVYEEHLGAVDLKLEDEPISPGERDRIDVVGFKRDFAESCQPGSDLGYVLLTSGMSNRRMNVPPDIDAEVPRRAELMRYVRKPTKQIVGTLSWLAKVPFIDNTWFGFGLRVPMPEPPITGCEFRTFFLPRLFTATKN